jgi:hypothetical protein
VTDKIPVDAGTPSNRLFIECFSNLRPVPLIADGQVSAKRERVSFASMQRRRRT